MNMNIKLDRIMVIKKLIDKIAAAKDQAAEIKKQEAAYEKEVQKWTKECEAIIRKNSVGIRTVDTYFNYKTDSGKYRVEIEYLLDEKIALPEKPEQDRVTSYVVAMKQIKEMERMRDILIMCTDETISSKVYQNIIEYIVD